MLRIMACTHEQSATEPSWAHDTAPALAHLIANQTARSRPLSGLNTGRRPVWVALAHLGARILGIFHVSGHSRAGKFASPARRVKKRYIAVEYSLTRSTSYTGTAVEPGTLYVYRVQAADFLGLVGEASEPASVRVPESNSPATAAPAISGMAQAGETLTATTAGISDDDGLINAAFAHQWLADDSAISGVTGSTYTLAVADEGKAVKVRVSFSDDAGNDETLTSGATGAVLAARGPLTAKFLDAQSSHDGQTAFTFELRFSEEFDLSYLTLRDHAFTVSGGEVTKARRLEKPGNIRWQISVMPDGDGQVAVVLPATNDCGDQGAICTGDGRRLSGQTEISVSGPGGYYNSRRWSPGGWTVLKSQRLATANVSVSNETNLSLRMKVPRLCQCCCSDS